mgnify:CR=1 FL=1
MFHILRQLQDGFGLSASLKWLSKTGLNSIRSHELSLTEHMLNELKKYNLKSGLIHTDQGVLYTSKEYKNRIKEAGYIQSMSRKANCWDNACIESFHSLIKREWLNRYKIFDYNQAYTLVFDYIETFYNTVRIHSHCNYLSPANYELQYQKQIKNCFFIQCLVIRCYKSNNYSSHIKNPLRFIMFFLK